jgi:exonuclease 3'-5' domain-containing protein 1
MDQFYLLCFDHLSSLADNIPELPCPPCHIVTKPGQLPVEFLEPSAAQKLVIGFDCEGVDLCRNGALCIMQVSKSKP